MVGDNIQPADQERRIDKTIEKIDGGVHDPVGRGGIVVQILGSMRLLWNRAAVAVCFDGTVVGGSPGGIGQVFDIVADGEDNLVGYDFFIYKIEGELVCHFFQNELCFVCLIRTMQNLPGADAVGFRFVGFDFRDGAGFKAPGVVDQKLCIFSEKPIEQVFIFDRAACDIPHREQSIFGKLSGIAVSDAPEVSERLMCPELLSECHFIEKSDAHAVFICREVLCYDIHCNLAEKKIRPDAGSSGDSCRIHDIENNFTGKFAGSHSAGGQIIRNVHKNLVDGINDDILRRDIFHIDGINSGAAFHIMCHLGRRDQKINGECRILRKLREKIGCTGKYLSGRMLFSFDIDFPDSLLYFKKTTSSGHAKAFQRWCDSKTDGFVCTADVCHDKVGVKGVKAALPTFYGSVKGL